MLKTALWRRQGALLLNVHTDPSLPSFHAPLRLSAYIRVLFCSEGAEPIAILVLRSATAAAFFWALHLLGWTCLSADPVPDQDPVTVRIRSIKAPRTKMLAAWLTGAAVFQVLVHVHNKLASMSAVSGAGVAEV